MTPKDTFAALMEQWIDEIAPACTNPMPHIVSNRLSAMQRLADRILSSDQIAEELEERGWQSIETAPKDGTTVDLWSPKYGRFTGCVWTKLYKRNDYQWFQYGSNGHEIEATHWMPLPAPPNAIEASIDKGDK